MASGGDFKQYSSFGRVYESGEKDLNRTIENNLKVFRPMIVRDLDYQVFLMYPHFSLDQKKELHRMGKAESNAEDVVERGLQMIAELRNCPTKYTDFLELLQDGDYREITKILKGEILPNNDEYRNHVNLKLGFICQKVNSEQIVNELLKRNVIGERDLQTVRNLQRDCSQVNAMAELMLIMLPRKTELWYPYFIEALLEMDADVAEEVDHDLCEKLKQRRQKGAVSYMEDEMYLLKDYKPSVPVSSGVLTRIKDIIVGGSKQSKKKTLTDGSSCEELERKIESGYIKKTISSYVETVQNLSQEELKFVENTTASITMNIDQPNGIITLRGPSRTVSEVDSNIQRKLITIERKKRNEKEAKTLFDLVKWHYEDFTSANVNLVAYDEKANLIIETAYKDNKPNVRLEDSTGNTYVIDFGRMVEYPEADKTDEIRVIRKDIIKGGDANLPQEWVPMADNENIKVVNIQSSDQEYKTIESTFVKGAQNGAYTSRIPNVAGLKVTKIERIQNKTLYQQYMAKKKQMQGEKPSLPANMPLERTLWHGTADAAVASIQRHGFNRSYNGKNVWFGAGVYFAGDASYSARPWLAIGQQNPPNPPGQNKGYIFMCKVLTGQFTKGDPKMRYLPPVDPSKSKTLMFDCAVDNLANPVEFVIFHDTQAYPEYIITFTL